MGAVKNGLKKILPPPVSSFMREVNRIVGWEEKNQNQLLQLQGQVEQQNQNLQDVIEKQNQLLIEQKSAQGSKQLLEKITQQEHSIEQTLDQHSRSILFQLEQVSQQLFTASSQQNDWLQQSIDKNKQDMKNQFAELSVQVVNILNQQNQQMQQQNEVVLLQRELLKQQDRKINQIEQQLKYLNIAIAATSEHRCESNLSAPFETTVTKVSVIIPVYNVEKYLVECLDSVANQTLKEIEIICVNDGSTDNSLSTLNEYAQKDNRFIVRTQANKGASIARNVGLQVASGEYIYFMDSDDYIELDCLEKLYSIATKNELDVIYFNADAFFETDELKDKHNNYCTYYDRKHVYSECVSGTTLLQEMDHNGDYRPAPWLQLLRRDYLKEQNITFYEGIIHEDNLFSFLCIVQAERVMHIGDVLFHRRIREGSIMTHDKSAKNVIGYFICFVEMLKYALRDDQNAAAYKKRIQSVMNNAIKDYHCLDDREKEKIVWEQNSFEAFLFDTLMKKK